MLGGMRWPWSTHGDASLFQIAVRTLCVPGCEAAVNNTAVCTEAVQMGGCPAGWQCAATRANMRTCRGTRCASAIMSNEGGRGPRCIGTAMQTLHTSKAGQKKGSSQISVELFPVVLTLEA